MDIEDKRDSKSKDYKKGSISESLFGESNEINEEFYQKSELSNIIKKDEEEEEEEEIKMDPKELEEKRKQWREEKDQRTIFIGNVPFDSKDKKIQNKIEKRIIKTVYSMWTS